MFSKFYILTKILDSEKISASKSKACAPNYERFGDSYEVFGAQL